MQERGGSRFGTHTDGQGNSVSTCHVHPASGTAAGGTFTTGPAGPGEERAAHAVHGDGFVADGGEGLMARASATVRRSRRAGPSLGLLLLVAIGALGWFVFLAPLAHGPERVVARPPATAVGVEPAVAPASRSGAVARENAGATAAAEESEAAFVCTFADGSPAPSLLIDLAAEVSGSLDWSAGRPRHAIPAAGVEFAVLARDFQVAFVSRRDLPERGAHRIDLQRSPVLDVRLVNVPPGLRERLTVQLQASHGQLPKSQNHASVLMGYLAPVIMQETDRARVALALPLPGCLVVHAVSRHSTHSYPTPKVPFEPVSQVIEMDLSVLASACSLADMSLTLRFPYAHPDGEMDLSLLDAAGSSMMSQRRRREGQNVQEYGFRDLPRAIVRPFLQLRGSVAPSIPLEPIDLTGGNTEVARDVVAESSLRVVVAGREGLAADGVSVLLRQEGGDCLVANWPRGDGTRFEHLPAMTLYAQAVGYDGRRCSSIVRVDLGVAMAHEVALQLVPAGEIEVPAGAFGAATRHLQVHPSGQDSSCVWLRAERSTLFWMPLGECRVEWAGGSRVFRVAPDSLNRWQ